MIDSNGVREKAVTLLERELGEWLERNKSLIIERIPERCKILPVFSGSIVEGFLSEGSDLDFSLIIDDREEKPRIKGKLSKAFKQFIDTLNMKVREVGLDHVCKMAYKIRTTTYLLAFEKCKNPQFRTNYFLFSKLISPCMKSEEIKNRLALPRDFQEFKKSLQEEYRRKYGYKPFEVKTFVLIEPERFSPKRIYRELQLLINTFIMTYGLEEKRLTEKMEKELQTKVKEILRSTLMKKAVRIIEPEVMDSLRSIKKLKEFAKKNKRKRLNFYVKSGYIEDEELSKIKRVLHFFKEFVYDPLLRFSEVQVKLADILSNDLNAEILWLGLRKDHAYIALHNHASIVCLDIIPRGEQFDVYVKVKKEIEKELLDTNCERVFEKTVNDSSFEVPLPYKTHHTFGRGRVHFKLLTMANKEDPWVIKEKLKTKLCEKISLF
jgi:hypothetical protein